MDEFERHLRGTFGATSGDAESTVVDRARAAADRQRRRRDWLVGAGAGLSALAVVGAFVVVPQLGDRGSGAPVVVASSDSPSPDEQSPTPSADLVTPTPTPTGTDLVEPEPAEPLVLTTLVPTEATVGLPGSIVQGGPLEAPAGAATLMGLQICDSIIVGERLGEAGALSAIHPQNSVFQTFDQPQSTSWAGDRVDVTISLMPQGQANRALEQLATNTGFCLWEPTTPDVTTSSTNQVTVELPTPYDADGRTAGMATVVGDVMIGVVVNQPSSPTAAVEAMARAQAITASIAANVQAKLTRAGG